MFKKSLTKNYNLNEHFLHLKFDFFVLGAQEIKAIDFTKNKLNRKVSYIFIFWSKKLNQNSTSPSPSYTYRDKICVYDEHPIAGQDIQFRAPDSRSRHTTPFDDYKWVATQVLTPPFPSYLVSYHQINKINIASCNLWIAPWTFLFLHAHPP